MRDIAITLFIAAWLPKVLKAPWIGALLFVWIGLMSPHRFGYGFAYGMPFAQIVAVVTVFGMVFSRQQARYVVDAPMIWMLLFPIWTCITYIFALEQDIGWNRWIEVMKIFISVHFISALIRTRRQIMVFVAVVTASVAVFGIKGGLFTLAAGGSAKVYGPPGESFMSDNNAIAVALIMVVPLLGWLGTLIQNKWQRIGIAVAGLLCLLLWSFYPFRRCDGQVMALLLTLYPIGRFLEEMIRDDEAGKFGTPLTISQIISIVVFVIALAFWAYLRRQPTGSVLPPPATKVAATSV